MNCRGHRTRERIVKEYDVKPEAHIKLLMNQTKYSDAGKTIENEYYLFSAKRKSDGNFERIQCGIGAARDFLTLIGHQGLSIFNPLENNDINDIYRMSKDNKYNTDVNYSENKCWNETAKQLYNAIMWLIILWDAEPKTPLFDFKDDVIKYKNLEPYEYKIKRVNSAIKNGGKGRTLTDIINDYRECNNIRNDICDFGLLKNKINNMSDKNGNKIKSYF